MRSGFVGTGRFRRRTYEERYYGDDDNSNTVTQMVRICKEVDTEVTHVHDKLSFETAAKVCPPRMELRMLNPHIPIMLNIQGMITP